MKVLFLALWYPNRQNPVSAIAALMNDSLLCQGLAGRGYELSSNKFSWTLNAQVHQEVYQRLLGIGTAKPRKP